MRAAFTTSSGMGDAVVVLLCAAAHYRFLGMQCFLTEIINQVGQGVGCSVAGVCGW